MVAEDGSFCPVSLTTLTEPTLAVRAGSWEKVTGLGMWIWGGRVVEGRQETSPCLGETEEMREQRETGALIFRSRSLGFVEDVVGNCIRTPEGQYIVRSFPQGPEPAAGEGTCLSPAGVCPRGARLQPLGPCPPHRDTFTSRVILAFWLWRLKPPP